MRGLILLLCLHSAVAVAAPPRSPPPASAPPPPATSQPPPGLPVGATPAPPKLRVAITEHALEGEGAAPALAMQLQDGFVLGLVRAGIDVLYAIDVAKRLASAPELVGCETSPCLKRLGELLGVRYVIRVRVSLTGNSYKMTARLFSVEGAAPAALPIAAQSRACDVCTAGEAREQMIRLADGVRARIEEHTAPPPTPLLRPGSHFPRLLPLLALGAGLAAIVGGAMTVRAASGDEKSRVALGGGLMGAGLCTSAMALYFSFVPPGLPDANAGARSNLMTAFVGVRMSY